MNIPPFYPNVPLHIILSLSQNSYALSRATTRIWLSHAEKTGPKPRKENVGAVLIVRDGELKLGLPLLVWDESSWASMSEATLPLVMMVYSLSAELSSLDPVRQRSSSSSRTAREAKRARMRKVRTGPLWVWRESSRERAIRKMTRTAVSKKYDLCF